MKGFMGFRQKEDTQTEDIKAVSRNEEHDGMSTSSLANTIGQRWSAARKWVVGTAGAAVLISGVVFAGNQYVDAKTVPYYHVYIHGEEIGTIDDPSRIDKLYSQKRQEYQKKYPNVVMGLHTENITTKLDRGFQAKPNTQNTLDKLGGKLKAYAEGVELKVNGKAVGIVKDQATVNAALEKVKQKYAPQTAAASGTNGAPVQTLASSHTAAPKNIADASAVKKVKIEEKVTSAPVQTDPNKVLTADGAAKLLTTGKDEPIVYTVEEGDTISSIASQFHLRQKEIFANNPQVKEKYMQIGDQLQLTVPKPFLTVTTVEKVSEQVPTEPDIEIRKSKELPLGKSKVVRPGIEGMKVMNYVVTKKNGRVVDEQWVGQKVIKRSLPEVVLQGTQVPDKGKGNGTSNSKGKGNNPAKSSSKSSGKSADSSLGKVTGRFAWPVSGASISSSFGSRWGRLHEGIDIVGSRTIKAADGGVVTFTGQINGYGNAIIISHGNGYQTLYGHLRSISTHKGAHVNRGTAIGVMGSTGRSTGTHLHFEIHKNGSSQNPMKYLN
ncbi:peptidoglycan DD-metalloendopeptidase family protein [Paenibacillus sp.]|jgi:murein DD-endopeptidase MepM/ murein hydrolase activator NlpD|uniref:peptidoglycan DD-metalloendopeptidase family protein n=1 Tax=Paenibacillus sp. TaxID=58172 RepID=UPI0028215AE9|nr:peptidoglycan DD-metalloendopeptidase family protein [Paenibacillus sp.]MDR0267851.1 peptidoglycan DD-metalloendopeptidase family protein [Paenibacillus sp.]